MDGYDLPQQAGSTPANPTRRALFKRGFQTSFKPFPMPLSEERQFPVKGSQETEQLLSLQENEEVMLVIRAGHIVMVKDDKQRVAWPLTDIRRLGCSKNNFHFEAGRKAPTGEGYFSFHTDGAKRLYDCLNDMKDRIRFDLLCQRGVALEQMTQVCTAATQPLQPPSPKHSRSLTRKFNASIRKSQTLRSHTRKSLQPDLTKTTHTSEPDLAKTTHTWEPHLARTTHTSEPHLAKTTHTSEPHLAKTSHTSEPHLAKTTHTSEPHLVKEAEVNTLN